MRGDALQTFKNITSPDRENLGEILTVFRRKNVKPQSMATAEHKFQRLVCNATNQKLIDFLDGIQNLGKGCIRSCRSSDHWTIHICQNASPPEEMNQPGAFGEWHIWSDCVTSWKEVVTEGLWSARWTADKRCDATSRTTKLRKAQTNLPPLQYAGHYRNQCRQLKREKDQARNNTNSVDNKNNNSGQTNYNSNKKISKNTNEKNTNKQKDRRPTLVYPPCETCSETNHFTEKCHFRANAADRPPPRKRRPEGQNQVHQTNARSNSHGNVQAAAQTFN